MKNPNRRWRNKESGDEVMARPYFEMVEPILELNQIESIKAKLNKDKEGNEIKFGPVTSIIQCGWLIRNKNDVYFVMPIGVQEQFEDTGEWENEK